MQKFLILYPVSSMVMFLQSYSTMSQSQHKEPLNFKDHSLVLTTEVHPMTEEGYDF